MRIDAQDCCHVVDLGHLLKPCLMLQQDRLSTTPNPEFVELILVAKMTAARVWQEIWRRYAAQDPGNHENRPIRLENCIFEVAWLPFPRLGFPA
jgi:hypothetical protein